MRHSQAQAAAPETTWLGRLAGWSYDRRRRVLAVWVVTLVGVIALGAFIVTGRFTNKLSGGSSEAQTAQTFLAARFPTRAGDPANVVFHTTGPVAAPATQAQIAAVLARLAMLAHVTGVRSPFDPGVRGQVSPDGHIAYASV